MVIGLRKLENYIVIALSIIKNWGRRDSKPIVIFLIYHS